MKDHSTLLFNQYELMLVLDAQEKKIKQLMSAVPPKVLVESDVENLVSKIEQEIQVEPLELLEDETNVEQTEVKVDVSQDFHRAVFDRSKPFYVDGVRVSYYVPFKGDKELLKCRPNAFSFNPPHARIAGSELAFDYDRADRDIAATKTVFAQNLSNVRQWIGNSRDQVATFNSGLAAKIRQQLTSRQQSLKANQQQIGDLGFKVRPKKEELLPKESTRVLNRDRRHERKLQPWQRLSTMLHFRLLEKIESTSNGSQWRCAIQASDSFMISSKKSICGAGIWLTISAKYIPIQDTL
jgi:hypothetical protein